MKLPEKTLDIVLTAATVLAAAWLAIGGLTPADRLKEHETRLDVVEHVLGGQGTDIAVLQTDVKYIRSGMDELLDRKRGKR